MPKKRVNNAFYFFMLDFKQEQSKKGIDYRSMAEVAEAASSCWDSASASVRAKYADIVKKEKQSKVNFPDLQEQQLLLDKEESDFQDIKNMVKQKSSNGAIFGENFYLMDVNYYCKTSNGSQYLIAECTVLCFNLKEGIKDQYHVLLNPGKIPIGYTYEAKMGSKEIGLELPDEMQKKSNYIEILSNLIDYLKKQDPDMDSLPPLYTLPDKIEPIINFILQMCSLASEDYNIFHIFRLDTLFFTMVNALKTCSEEGFHRESQALAKLTNDIYKFFTPGMGCQAHDLADKTIQCTTTRTKCWAYKVLDMCCPLARLEMKLVSHVPTDQHLDNIHIYKLQTRERAMPPVAGMYGPCSSNVSVVSAPISEAATNNDVKQQRRKYEPVRMPKKTYTRSFVAPDITESSFTPLSIGLGRGRGLISSFASMSIKK